MLTISGTSFVQRQLPAGYSPGSPVTVTLQANPGAQVLAYVVEDVLPANWTASNISDNGLFDPITQKVKFGPFLDTSARTLTYSATPPATASGQVQFTGDAVADGVLSIIGGANTLASLSFLPADNDPADWRITDVELTAYAAAWKRGTSWPEGPNPIPASYVSRAGTLWRGGEYYKLDATVASGAPLWWVNTTAGPQGLAGHGKPQVGLQSSVAGAFTIQVPDKYVPGVSFSVTSEIDPPTGTQSYVAEQQVPAGWTASDVSDGGTFDAVNSKVKWGLFFDSNKRQLSYSLQPSPTNAAPINITGVASFDGADVLLTGNTASIASTKLDHASRNGKGGLDLDLTGAAGQNFVIEVSTDLINWTQVKTFNNANGLVHFEDSDAQALRQMFFRAVQTPSAWTWFRSAGGRISTTSASGRPTGSDKVLRRPNRIPGRPNCKASIMKGSACRRKKALGRLEWGTA
jgi:hypothetical protein